ncbi:hypothetical protein FHX81_2556 [Saccharothrix saharensis]|uniref:Uncharacterized protein n=1 Tax=Saccharothrix saharensis TaxID=571190 RepID=A0A543JBK9_9PSEU|nr:hypothetical protein [Saccharothrix saharensis]TQM80228.1 hypothetical protein FHX81_2556 [Saccharothrix saharensis]
MTEQRQHLTTEDFAERTPADREPVEQTPADRDVVEPDLTDQERFDREPTPDDERTAHHQPTPDQQPGGRTTSDGYSGSGFHDSGHHDNGYHDNGYREPEHAESDAHTGQTAGTSPTERDEPVELSAVDATAGDAPLFTPDDAADYQAEWRALQADFVDDPREAVQRADELVAQVMQTLATTFNEHKHALEEQWQRGDEVQTEELRQALKRYRTFFDRLLSV